MPLKTPFGKALKGIQLISELLFETGTLTFLKSVHELQAYKYFQTENTLSLEFLILTMYVLWQNQKPACLGSDTQEID